MSDTQVKSSRKHTGRQSPSFFRSYFAESSSPQNAALYILPIVLIYQLGILFTGGVQNGVDFVTPKIFSLLSFFLYFLGYVADQSNVLLSYALLLLVVSAIYIYVIYRGQKESAASIRIWPIILLESVVYAFFFGQVVLWLMSFFEFKLHLSFFHLTSPLAHPMSTAIAEKGGFSALVLSFGAGFYEELVFRVMLLSGGVWLMSKQLKMSRFISVVIAVIVSSLVFSAIHHIGALGDPFSFDLFFFRFFAGVVLASIYAARGFSVAVYTHAFYDVFVMVF